MPTTPAQLPRRPRRSLRGRPRRRAMPAVALVLPALLVLLASGPPRAAAEVEAPPGDTVVDVRGDAADGFDIQHYDGTVDHPPTRSEAQSECTEYDRFRDRVRCHAEVRTWYRDLAVLQQALDHAHAAGGA